MDAEVVKAGIKYVSGDLTFNLGIVDGEGTDNAFGSTGGSADSMNKASASVSYAVASGVTAILGYSNSDFKMRVLQMIRMVQLGTLVPTCHSNYPIISIKTALIQVPFFYVLHFNINTIIVNNGFENNINFFYSSFSYYHVIKI